MAKKSDNSFVRSSALALKFANSGKRAAIAAFLAEYARLVRLFVDIAWEGESTKFAGSELYKKGDGPFNARLKQCAAKQACGIVAGTKKKNEKRSFVIQKMAAAGKFKKARKLQAFVAANPSGKPDLKTVQAELDNRFVDISFAEGNSFDGWLTISGYGGPEIIVPLRATKHFNKMVGAIGSGVRLSDKFATFTFKTSVAPVETGRIIGVDIGALDTIACSDGMKTGVDAHGHSLGSILDGMARKNKGSKAFLRAAAHRTNFINWSVNQINLSGVSELRREKIFNLRLGKRSSRKLARWTYTDIIDKLESRCQELGVRVTEVSPTYTSQRCSCCNWVCKRNRKGKAFKCSSCGFTADADLNAALNIALPLPSLPKAARLQRWNLKGFYWGSEGYYSPLDPKKVIFKQILPPADLS